MQGTPRIRASVALAVLIVSSLSILITIPEGASAYTPHAPIMIEGNLNFTAANGVVSGGGTTSDPYIIGGWEINASTSVGISIIDTDAHFVVQDVLVRDGESSTREYTGILFMNVVSGVITKANITRNSQGISIESGSDITISDSNLSYNHDGIHIQSGSRISIRNVTSWMDVTTSFDLGDSSSVTITDCRIYSNSMSPWLGVRIFSVGSDLTVERSTFIGGSGVGIRLSGAAKAEIRNNVVRDIRGDGILLEYSSRISIHDNDFVHNGEPAPAGLGGVDVYGSDSVFIFRNNFTLNHLGVVLSQAGADQSRNVIVHHNNFSANVVQAAQEWYSVVGNAWDDGYPSGGNYWNDYSGWDNYSGVSQDQQGSDGVGDTPYDIFEDAKDRYPLMEPGGAVNSPPVAIFTVTPSDGNISTVFGFNASASYDAEDPADVLTVRWDFEDDGTWDTGWAAMKTAVHQYTSPGAYVVCLAVSDSRGSIVETTHTLNVINLRPNATFNVTPPDGSLGTVFDFNASAVSDFEDSSSLLEVRWDWEDDGVWDTSWSTTKTAQHQYPSPGIYTIRLEVMDTGGLVDTTTKQVEIIDNVAPIMTHNPHDDVLKGNAIIITATVTDDVGVEAVYLHYKAVGASTFIEVRMMKTTGDTYEATIPAQSEPGTVYYYINATDAAGNEARHPQTGEHSLQIVEEEWPPLTDMTPVVIAVIAAMVIVVAIIAAVILFLNRRKKRRQDIKEQEESNESPPKSPD